MLSADILWLFTVRALSKLNPWFLWKDDIKYNQTRLSRGYKLDTLTFWIGNWKKWLEPERLWHPWIAGLITALACSCFYHSKPRKVFVFFHHFPQIAKRKMKTRVMTQFTVLSQLTAQYSILMWYQTPYKDLYSPTHMQSIPVQINSQADPSLTA